MSPNQLEFKLEAYELAAVEWGAGSTRRVIALHGWLDNAGTFDLLAPLLTDCHIVAFDAAGHGLSGNRSPDAAYNVWQEVSDVVDVAEQLGWSNFSLLGHSRGAAVAALFAGTFPDRVRHLMLLEGGLPMLGAAEDTAENLAQSLTKNRERRGRKGRVFASRETAIAERADGFTPVSLEAAEILARRSLREVEGGWQWHADQRLKVTSELKLTRESLAPFLSRISAPTLCLFAGDSPFADREDFKAMLPLIRDIKIGRIAGRHHFHLEGAEKDIAPRLLEFLALHPAD